MELLNVSQSYEADQGAARAGVPGLSLMESAGAAIAHAIEVRWEKRQVLILAGPGNNGGDGFVVARVLKKAGWPVTVCLLGAKAALKGDAATNAKRWPSKVQSLDVALDTLAALDDVESLLVVDALFGAGLSKPLSGAAKSLAEILNIQRDEGRAPAVVSVDMPSGVNGDTGRTAPGVAFSADLTVTFCRLKPGHLLMPGRAQCGEVVVADIGISDEVVAKIAPQAFLNGPDLWMDAFPHPDVLGNKYGRGHVVVQGGAVMCGAARLAALAARRLGAGLVTIAVPDKVFDIYISAVEPGTLVAPFTGLKGFRKLLSDPRKTTCVLGPGAGASKSTRNKVLAALTAGKACVLDADALSVFKGDADVLFKAIKAGGTGGTGRGDVVLTPHGGEFARLFPALAKKQAALGKLETTRRAAKRAGCVILYKGPDTVVATPDGRAAITANAPPTLASAGTGDVLAGFVGALLAQGMAAFDAAGAAAWLHAECANGVGPGLIAEDLPDAVPDVLEWLFDGLD